MKTCFSNKLKKYILYPLCIGFIALSITGKVSAGEVKDKIIVLSGVENEQTHSIAKEVLIKAYKRIGYEVRFKYFPGKRALESASQGITDGEVGRIKGTEKTYPDLIQIQTPVTNFKGVAFTKTVTGKINSWEDLKGLRVGVIRGIRYSTIGASGLNPFFAKDMTHLFKLLSHGDIQIAVATLNAGKIEINKNYRKSGIHVVGTPLVSAPLYHFVHKKNKHLVTDLDNALKEMENSGEIENINKITLGNLLKPRDKIIWPYVCFPPLYICENEKLVDGAGYHILKLIWNEMPEYEHEIMLSPVKRILEAARSGEKQLFYGFYKTPEREEFLHYSLPCRISTPTFVIFRKSGLQQFANENEVSLEHLLENTKYKMLILNAISFGAGIDELLSQHKQNPNVLVEYNTTNMGKKSLRLLINKRVDYILSLDGISYDARELGVLDQLAYFRLKEKSKYEVGYIAGPKTEWGFQIIKKINDILRKEIPSDSFFQIFRPLVNEEMIPELRREFNKKILEPSRN